MSNCGACDLGIPHVHVTDNKPPANLNPPPQSIEWQTQNPVQRKSGPQNLDSEKEDTENRTSDSRTTNFGLVYRSNTIVRHAVLAIVWVLALLWLTLTPGGFTWTGFFWWAGIVIGWNTVRTLQDLGRNK